MCVRRRYWKPGQKLKTLPYLIGIYERTVGHNANLLLGTAPNYAGEIPAESAALYRALGTWVERCHGRANTLASNWSSGGGGGGGAAAAPPRLRSGESLTIVLAGGGGSPTGTGGEGEETYAMVGRVVVQEDQAAGQRVRRFRLCVVVYAIYVGVSLPVLPRVRPMCARPGCTWVHVVVMRRRAQGCAAGRCPLRGGRGGEREAG
jgi:hypothetical protein